MTAVQPMPLLLDPMPHASADAPIGVFDSGIGGLSIAQEIAQHLPNERILYYADTAHVPMVRVQIKRFASLLLKQLSGCIDKVAKLQLSLVTLLQLLVWIICEIIMVSVFQS